MADRIQEIRERLFGLKATDLVDGSAEITAAEEFIRHAPYDVRYLLGEVERLRFVADEMTGAASDAVQGELALRSKLQKVSEYIAQQPASTHYEGCHATHPLCAVSRILDGEE